MRLSLPHRTAAVAALALAVALAAGGCKRHDAARASASLFREADAAVKRHHAARYQVESTAAGPNAAPGSAATPRVTARVVVSGWANGPARYRAEAHIERGKDAQDLVIGRDGDTYYLIDPTQKLVRADSDPSVIGSAYYVLQAVMMLELVHPMPFAEEIAATDSAVVGERTVGGEPCAEVHVAYANGTEATWLLSKRDHVPRGVKRVVKLAAGRFENDQVLTGLELDPALDPAELALKVPAGYTRTRQAAP